MISFDRILKKTLTQHSQPVVDGNHDNITVSSKNVSIIEVATAPGETVSVDEENHWQRR